LFVADRFSPRAGASAHFSTIQTSTTAASSLAELQIRFRNSQIDSSRPNCLSSRTRYLSLYLSAGNGALGVLIQIIGRVSLDSQVGAGLVSVGTGAQTVSDVIEKILELLPRHIRTIGPIAFS